MACNKDFFDQEFKRIQNEIESEIRRMSEEMDRIENEFCSMTIGGPHQRALPSSSNYDDRHFSGPRDECDQMDRMIEKDMKRVHQDLERIRNEMFSFVQSSFGEMPPPRPVMTTRDNRCLETYHAPSRDIDSIEREFIRVRDQIERESRRLKDEIDRMRKDMKRQMAFTSDQRKLSPPRRMDNYPDCAGRQLTTQTTDMQPWICESDQLVQNNSSGNNLDITIDLREYLPEEISVNVENDRLLVYAVQNRKLENRNIKKGFKYEVNLPKGTNCDQVTKTLTTDGFLNIRGTLPSSIQKC